MKGYNNISLSDIPEQYKELASLMGIDKFKEFCFLYGGSNIYVPNLKTLENHLRNDDILKLHNESKLNIKDIAKKFNISTNYVRYIIKKSPSHK